MPEPIRLYTVKEIADDLGVKRTWVNNRTGLHTRDADAPQPEFTTFIGGKDPIMLWSETGVQHWHAYAASQSSRPKQLTRVYSDHRASNTVGGSVITWKLWWRNGSDGPMWWFATPDGWWTSEDDGVSWKRTGLMVRPEGWHYYSVIGSVKPSAAVASILRSATALRRRIEGSTE